MKNLILEKRDIRWFIVLPILDILLTGSFMLISKLILHINFSTLDFFIIGGLFFISSAAICGFSYAGLNIAALFSIVGTLFGFFSAVYVFLKPIEHSGIVGIVTGAQTAFIFFLVGVNVQMIMYILRKNLKKGENKNGKNN